jgi:hypothetical protein
MNRRLHVELPADWGAIKALWDPCVDHLSSQGLDSDTSYQLAMVTQELLENAVKYGGFSQGRERIDLAISTRKEAVVIEVRTPLDPDLSSLRRLDAMVQWIRGFQNPFEAFVERLKEVSARPYAVAESGLGLVRVAYEGGCLLDFFVDERDVLAMSAVFHSTSKLPEADHGGSRDLHA